MKNLNFKTLAILAFAGLISVGCEKGSDSTSPAAPVQNPEIAQDQNTQEYKTKCQKADIFKSVSGAEISDQDELLKVLSGKYELDQVHIHHKETSTDGKLIGSFYATATRNLGNSNTEETILKYECDEYNENSGFPIITGVSIPVAGVVYSPSGRITVFDQYTQMDNPEFNLPLLAEVHFDSIGRAHYKNSVGISGPPYYSNRYLKDVIMKYSSNPRFFLRPNGGFEMRTNWYETKKLDKDKSFDTENDVVITYKKTE